MKYVEPVKSAVLFLLVMLSVVLTFVIWTYTPDYKYIEKTEGEEVEIGAKKNIQDVIKPYKAIFRENEGWTGTASNMVMKDLMNAFSEWTVLDVESIDGDISKRELNELVREQNRFTVFFSGEVPFSAFNSVLQFSDKELPETTFNRIIIDWDKYNTKELDVFFVSGNHTSLLRSHVRIPNANRFLEEIIEPSKKYSAFKEIERVDSVSLYVIADKVELLKYTYIIDELPPELFENVLFPNPNNVKRIVESSTSEKYRDAISLMTIDKQFKLLNYVYPAAESSEHITSSKLFKDSFEFVNEHGGFNADYRFVSINTSTNQMEYQLYSQGFPVYSDLTATCITTVWGDNHIFEYKRPFYSLDMDITTEKEIKGLPAGTEVIEKIRNLDKFVLSDIDDIVVGYYLTPDDNQRLFNLEPSWFAIYKGSWVLLTQEMLGGVANGLE